MKSCDLPCLDGPPWLCQGLAPSGRSVSERLQFSILRKETSGHVAVIVVTLQAFTGTLTFHFCGLGFLSLPQ